MSEPVVIQAVCGNCAFWRKVEMSGPVEIGAVPRGNCFCLPPTPVAIFAANMRSVTGQTNIRPAVKADDSCGMFQLHPSAVPEEVQP